MRSWAQHWMRPWPALASRMQSGEKPSGESDMSLSLHLPHEKDDDEAEQERRKEGESICH